MRNERVTYMEVDLGAIKNNVETVKNIVPFGVGIIGVAKCDGYGLGLEPITQTLISSGCEKVAISTLDEVAKIRDTRIEHTLMMLYPPLSSEIAQLVDYDTEIMVDSMDVVEEIALQSKDKNKQTKIHLMVDTGMNRFGIAPDEVLPFFQKSLEMEYISVEGICSHFATASRTIPDPKIYDQRYSSFAVTQFTTFMEVIKRLGEHGYSIPTIHLANSAAILGYPDTIDPRTFHPFMPESKLFVRPGGLLYGLYGDINKDSKTQCGLKRVVSHVSSVTEIDAGESVGYGKRWVAPEKAKIATIPVGFGDHGYLIRSTAPPPLDQEPTQVLINGERCTIVGLVASSTFSVELNSVNAYAGDEVVLIGEQNGEQITLDEVADRNGLISMQLQTLLGAKMHKVYVT